MNRFARRLALALCIATTGSVAVPAARAQTPPAQAYQSKVLANGLQVIVVEDHAAPVAQEQMWYRFGSLYETKGKTGLAHGLEHMFFRGTPSLSSAGFDDMTARLGAEVNAQTQNDTTHFYMVLPADKVELAIHVDADRLAHLSLKESDWKLEKGAVLSEIASDYSQPISKLYYAVRQAAFPDSPYGLTALGVKADVERSTAADLRRYYDEWYHPNNATLVVTGDVKADDVFRWAQEYFGSIPSKPLPTQTPPPLPPAPNDAQVTVKADFPYAVYDLVYRTEGELDRGSATSDVLASVISNQRSPFYKALVESGLTLQYSAFNDTTLNSGLLHVIFILSPGKTAAEVRKAFDATVDAIKNSGVAPDLVDAAKKSVAAQATYARDSMSGLGDRYGYAIAIQRRDPEVYDSQVAAVTPADVDATLKREVGTPNVEGSLVPEQPKPGARGGGNTSSSVSDNFSARVPNGPVVQAPWVKAALAQPVTNTSKVNPAEFALPNGLRLYVQEVHANPTVFVSGAIRSSPAFDPPQRIGLADFTSNLLSYGSKKYDFQAQRKISDDLAADLALGSSFSAHGFARDLDQLLDLIADSIRNPAFPSNYVELVRSQELASISRRESNPDYKASRAFAKLILPPGDPALREDTAATVKAITVQDLKEYATRYYRPDLTRIVVTGDVTPDEVRSKVAAKFADWSNVGPKPDPALRPIPLPKPATATVESPRDAVSVRIGTPTLSRLDPNFYALNLVNSILGAGGLFESRLMSEVRVKRGLAYGISSSLDVNRYRGTFTINFSADPRKVRPALSVVRQQLSRIQRQPVTATELSRAKTRIYSSALVAEQATEAIVASVGNIASNDLPTDYYRTLRNRYDRLSQSDLLRAARRFIHPDHLVTVFEGPRF